MFWYSLVPYWDYVPGFVAGQRASVASAAFFRASSSLTTTDFEWAAAPVALAEGAAAITPTKTSETMLSVDDLSPGMLVSASPVTAQFDAKPTEARLMAVDVPPKANSRTDGYDTFVKIRTGAGIHESAVIPVEFVHGIAAPSCTYDASAGRYRAVRPEPAD